MNLQGNKANTPQQDLVWNLDRLCDRELTERLLSTVTSRLCIHSGSTGRLHADYRLAIPPTADHLIVQPDTTSPLDTYHHVPAQALQRTGLYLLPGQQGMLLSRLSADGQPLESHPLKKAMALILAKFRQRGEAFLPVLIKGDLETGSGLPRLHLHRLLTSELPHLSPFERHALQQAVSGKLLELCRSA